MKVHLQVYVTSLLVASSNAPSGKCSHSLLHAARVVAEHVGNLEAQELHRCKFSARVQQPDVAGSADA
jgi:hypothetical protein